MTRSFTAAFVVISLASLAAVQRSTGGPAVPPRTESINGRLAAAGEVLIKFRRAPDVTQLDSDLGADRSEFIGGVDVRRVHSTRYGVAALLSMLSQRADVMYVEPNYIVQIADVPNDPSFPQLWGLLNTGQTVNGTAGTPGADIHATAAWNVTKGSRTNVVAVVDTGVDYTHPDLVGNLWSAPSAFSVTIGGVMINCAAGTHGFNTLTNTCDPMDDNGHGTHVTGTIGAVGNNGLGVVGVNQVASIMASKFLDSSGSGDTVHAINAIEFAIQAKAVFSASGLADVRVLSNSWGGGGFSEALLEEIERAYTNDMLFVAAAGNNGKNNDTTAFYPADYNVNNVVAVAATDSNDHLASFSNYGQHTVDLGAPGVNILSTIPGANYTLLSGTSMATPHVAGAAALVLSHCAINTDSVKTALLNSVDPVPSLATVTISGGRLAADNAIQWCSGSNVPPTVALTAPTDGASYTAPATIVLTATAADSDGSINRVEFYAGSTLVGTATTSPYTVTWTAAPAGNYTFRAESYDNLGAAAVSAPVAVTVAPSGLPSPWAAQDIGSVGAAGSATAAGGTFTLQGSGVDIWDTADGFQYVYEPLTGDGQIVARVASVQNTNGWAKAGVMIREDLTAGAREAAVLVTPSNGVAFEWRAQSGGVTSYTAASGVAPAWVQLVRSGTTITAAVSSDGVTWTPMGSATVAMATNVFIGLGVTSHNNGVLCTATFDNVTTSMGSPDVPPTVSLISPTEGASFTAPATVALSATAADSDGTISRVEFYQGTTLIATSSSTSNPYTATWTNVMAGSYTVTAKAYDNALVATVSAPAHVTVTGSSGSGLPSPWAAQDIGSVGAAGSATAAGGTFTLQGSGVDIWDTADGFQYVYEPLTGDGQIVARVASVQNTNGWAKAGVMIREDLTAGAREAAVLVTPSNGVAFEWRAQSGGVTSYTAASGVAPAWVQLVRSGTTITAAVSSDGVTWTPMGSATVAMATNVFIGLGVTSHNNGVLCTATFDNVTTSMGSPDVPPTVSLISPTEGASFTAPATVALSATAADSDGTISRVEFYQGTTLIATSSSTSNPYTATWTNVMAGSYTVTAKAYDNALVATVSAPAHVTVTGSSGSGLPSPWAAQDIGSVGAAGSATAAGGTFTLQGSGVDIWDTADGFQYVYEPLTGDGQIVARVASVQNTNGWAKAGVMIREDLTAGAREAAVLVTPSNGVAFEWRAQSGGVTSYTAASGVAPAWVQLVRSGTTITAAVSSDGVTWTPMGSATVAMATNVFIGLGVTSHNNGVLCTATFDKVTSP